MELKTQLLRLSPCTKPNDINKKKITPRRFSLSFIAKGKIINNKMTGENSHVEVLT
jgi:hypothetical protein